MADNTQLPSTGTGTANIKPTTRKVTYSGDADVDMQVVALAVVTGSDDAKTPTDVTAAAPLPVAAVGDAAHDAADTGKPLKIGGKAVDVLDSFPTDVGPGDRVDALFGLKGQLFVSLMGQDGSADPTTLSVQGIGGGVPLSVGLNQLNISQTPTVTSGAYAANDAMGGLLTFANAARVSGGSGLVQAVTILCKTPALLPSLEIVLFNQTFTNMADNGTWSPSDADMLNCIGSIPIAAWSDSTTNSIATRFGLAFPYVLTGTSLFGQLMTRTAVTLTSTSDIVIGITCVRD